MSYKQSTEQKALETRRNLIQSERKVLVDEIIDKQKTSGDMKRKIAELQTKIENIKEKTPSKIIVSEHAILRYLERVRGINLQEAEEEILTEASKKIIDELGNCKINTEAGFKIVVRNGIVVTINTKDKDEIEKGKK